jgi:hypothetical protein
MIALAQAKNLGYGQAMRTAMVKHGIVSATGAVAVSKSEQATQLGASPIAAVAAPAPAEAEVDIAAYGFTTKTVHMVMASEAKRFGIAGAALTVGDGKSMDGTKAALGFFEDLIRRGRLDDGGFGDPRHMIVSPAPRMKTHKLVKEGEKVMLRRVRIDCGLRGLFGPANP